MPNLLVVAALALVAATPSAAWALDHKNLDKGRPLRLEDAYPIATSEWAIEAGAGATFQRRSANRGLFPIEILYGAWSNLQLGIGTTLSTDPHEIDEQRKSGDLELSALYNFNQETLSLPAFGVGLELGLPTGVDSSGADVELKGIVTRSFDRLAVHVNVAYEFLTGTRGDERDGRYELVLGASYPVGAPRYTRTTVVGDVFTEQSPRRGDSNIVGAEVGFRHQLTPRIVIDAGVGTEFAGPADRSALFFTTGLSMGF